MIRSGWEGLMEVETLIASLPRGSMGRDPHKAMDGG